MLSAISGRDWDISEKNTLDVSGKVPEQGSPRTTARGIMIKPHPLKGPNRLKLGVFSANADGGLAITDVPERWLASWQDNLTAAQIADRAGLEFVLPIARWRGFGGRNKVREWSFETFTWAAGLAAATDRIGLFMTVHVPLVHPLYAAKSLATVDHISQGRAGLNIVCGWNPKEFGMFGTPLVEKGYDQAAEWIAILERLYAADEPLDHDGAYYHLKQAVSRPASIQKPRPVTMNAAFGGPGRDFAAANCDYLFTTFSELADAGKHVADINERAQRTGRRVGAYTVAHVVCRETQDEAEAYYERYAVTLADHAAVDEHMAGKKEFSQSHDRHAYERYRQRFAGGAGSYPLIGTPQRIADEMIAIAEHGYDGIALSFVSYTQELPYFCDRVLPILTEAGYRERSL
jgi:alkanesulfonate monooxygenase SsuD/methylene tetrahydromethanopterin reductase-like flavin-dependent oxidoreductase (luciferase family)